MRANQLSGYLHPFKGLYIILFTLSLIGSSKLTAQSVPVGMPFFEDALRRGQLMGLFDPNISFTIRPVDPVRAMGIDNPFGTDTSLFPLDSNVYSRYTDLRANLSFASGLELNKHKPGNKSNLRLTLLPVYLHTRYNQHHPYGWSDGPMVPARGLQQYVSGGIYMKAGIFEAQLRPEFVWSQNREFQNPPFRTRYIDMPERMGQSNYEKAFLGQSYVKMHLGPIAMGLSNENLWWGPGRKNSIILTNNAPGFGHFTLNSNKPIKTRIGTFEGQMVLGKLRRSGFMYPRRYTPGEWPPIAGNVVPDTANVANVYGYVNAMIGVYQPKWLPGLFLGATRVVQAMGDNPGIRDYIKILSIVSKSSLIGSELEGNKSVNRNQIISIFTRYLLKESHAEVYFEIGREDNWWDFEDLMTRPQYSTAYNVGFRKLYDLKGKGRLLEVSAEYTKIQGPVENIVNPQVIANSFYMHGNKQGWTNQGQVLGAGIGPGSNMMTAGVSYLNGFNSFGLHFERVIYNEDMFHAEIDYLKLGGPNPFFVDGSKHFVDWGFIFSHHTSFDKLMLGYQLHLLRTYNFQWNYDPYGGAGPFRFTGINVWSLNAELSLIYRF